MEFLKEYNGSAKEYIDGYIIPLLPKVDTLIRYSKMLEDYLKDDSHIRITRKFSEYKLRGNQYIYDNKVFTVSDNEAALWVYLEAVSDNQIITFESVVKNKVLPIAFALKLKEKEGAIEHFKVGRQKKGKEFGKSGGKLCHIFECSPRGKSINDLNVDKRMRRLLNPMNHFPFPSPSKYQMPYDYGEDPKFISLMIDALLENHYVHGESRDEFLEFANKSGVSAESIYSSTQDFQILFQLKTDVLMDNEIIATKTGQNQRVEWGNFYLSERLRGQGLIIRVANQGFYYNHDELLKDVFEDRFGPNGSARNAWENNGCYVRTTGWPKWAENHIYQL